MHVLATGSLVNDPVRRVSKNGNPFGTGVLKVATADDSVLVNVIAFGDLADKLLQHRQGQALAISGTAKLNSWTGKDGAERHGIAITATEIASAASARAADADRRRGQRDAA
jgi:single-stranded DNA-binding protein